MFHIFKPRPFHVALIGPSINPVFNAMSCGILSGLDRTRLIDYTFGVANGSNNEAEMKAIVEEVVFSQYYDLIFSMGKSSTRIAMELTKFYRTPIPVVFTGVFEPRKAGFIATENNSGNNLTGLESFVRDYKEQIEVILYIAESPLKKILLPYTSFGLNLVPLEISNAKLFLHEKNVEVINVVFEKDDNVSEKIIQHIRNVDMVMLPRDTSVLNHIIQIIDICTLFQKPLYTSDTISVSLGAAFGYGDSEFNVGLALAKKALPLLQERRKPSTIPTTMVEWQSHLEVNMAALAQQNFKVNLQKLEALPGVKLCHI